MNNLLKEIEKIKEKNPDVLVYLGASKGKEKFYEKFGFNIHSQGMLMYMDI